MNGVHERVRSGGTNGFLITHAFQNVSTRFADHGTPPFDGSAISEKIVQKCIQTWWCMMSSLINQLRRAWGI